MQGEVSMVVLDKHLQQQLASAVLAAEAVDLPPCTAEAVLAEGILAEGVLAAHEEVLVVVVAVVPASTKRERSHYLTVRKVVLPT